MRCTHCHLELHNILPEKLDMNVFLQHLGFHLQENSVALVIDAHHVDFPLFQTNGRIIHMINSNGVITTINADELCFFAQKKSCIRPDRMQEIIILARACNVVSVSRREWLVAEFAATLSTVLKLKKSLLSLCDQKPHSLDLQIHLLLAEGKLITQACILFDEGHQHEWHYLQASCTHLQMDLEQGMRCALVILQWYQQASREGQMITSPFSVFSEEQYRIAAELLHVVLPSSQNG